MLSKLSGICEFISWEDVEKISRNLSNKIKKSNFRVEVIIAIARDGLVPARILNDFFGKASFGIVKLKRYSGNKDKALEAVVEGEMMPEIAGKNVLIVDDMVNEGNTMENAIRYLREFKPAKIKTLAIYSHSKKIDYVGKNGKKFAIFPWSKIEEIKEFNSTKMGIPVRKDSKALKKMGFTPKDVVFARNYKDL